MSVPGQRRRNKAKVGTTKIRPGLFVLSVCARISHRKLLSGMSRSPPQQPLTRSKVPSRTCLAACCCRGALLAFLHLRQDLAAALQLRDLAISGLQTAQDAQKTAQDTLQFVQTRWEEAVQAKDNEAAEKWEEKVKRAEEKVERAEVKVETAEKKIDRAKVELDRAKQEVEKAKEAAKASVPAGRGQAGASACAVVAVAFGLQHSSMVTVCFLGLSS